MAYKDTHLVNVFNKVKKKYFGSSLQGRVCN